MKTVTVKVSFGSYSDSKLDFQSKTILQMMKENLNFPDPVPAYADVEAARKAFSDALAPARSGDRAAIAVKNANKEVLCKMLQRMGYYVNMVAMDDQAVLLTSGFTLEKQGTPSPFAAPSDVTVMNGPSGQMIVGVGSAPGAKSFVYQYTTDPVTEKSVWVSEGSTLKKHMFKNLTPGVKLWFRVVAVGAYAQQLASLPVEAIVI